jgi:branched-chain amino acid transport system substrate-binding protein
MRKSLAVVVIATGCFIALSFGTAFADAKPIKIGEIVSLTGETAESGKYQRQGAELAVEQINAAGGINGRKITLVYEDDQSTNSGAVTGFQRLLEDPEIVAVVGPTASTKVQALLPTINEAKIPVTIGGTNYSLTHSGCQWVFRCRPNDDMSAKVIAKYLVDELGQKKVAIVHSSDVFGSGGRDLLLPALKKLGAEVVFNQAYTNGEKDFTAVVQGLKKSGATGLATYMTYGTDLGVFARQLKQLGADVKWVGSASITGVDGMNLAGDALYGTYGVADFDSDASPTSKTYAAAYKAKFKEDPDFWSASAYDEVMVIAEAIKKSPDLKPENLRKAILAIRNFPGAEGEYNFDENGDGLDSYNVVRNDNGIIKLVTTVHVGR